MQFVPVEATELQCSVTTLHGFTLIRVVPAVKTTVSIRKQLLCGFQVSADHCQLSASWIAQTPVFMSVSMRVEFT